MRGPPSYLVGRRNVTSTPWNPERDALLARLWAEGYSASQIASGMDVDVTRCAVIGRVHRLKLPGRKPRAPASKSPPRPRVRQFVPKPPAPPPPEPPPPGEPRMRKLPLAKLKPTSCRWPVNDGAPVFLFCAAEAASGEVYCGFHRDRSRVRK